MLVLTKQLKWWCLAFVLITNPLKADFIVNGDLETGTFSPWSASGFAAVTSAATYRVSGGFGQFPRGNYTVNFGGADKAATGVISQQFTTVANRTYRLRFDYGAFGTLPDGTPANPQSLLVSVTNVANSQALFSTTVTDSTQSLNLASLMASYEFLFIATGTSTRLQFADKSVRSFSVDGVLDNISVSTVSAVPEPGSIALVSLGICGGYFVNRRKLRARLQSFTTDRKMQS